MTRNETHVHDSSTLANFKDWAMSIGAALTAFGWTQASDTGQVNWSTIASVPATNTYVYEVWQPGDGRTAFYIRIDYGNGTSPTIRIQGGTATNGSGTLTGFTTELWTASAAAGSGSTLFNCLYCGDSSSFSIMLWRDAGTAFNLAFGVDRSRDSSGAATSSYFSVMLDRTTKFVSVCAMQSVVFGIGAAQIIAPNNNHLPTLIGAYQNANGANSGAFNGNIGLSPVFPYVGYYDVPTLAFAYASSSDFTELAVITTAFLGSTHTYIFSKNAAFSKASGLAVLMRWE